MNIIRRLWQLLLTQGPRVAAFKIYNRLLRVNFSQMFRKSLHEQEKNPVLRAQVLKEAALGTGPVFSLIVPLYNTDLSHLSEMIESVQHQNYPRWQLCLADGSDAEHGTVQASALTYAASDHRICYQKLEQNLGISGNTNAALALATGDYIGLLDHDDLLAPQALAEIAVVIHRQSADLIYSDELNFSGQPENVRLIHYKPDFAPDNLRSNNYICHFTVFSRELSKKIGEFDPQCDGSQDYDYILRLSEQAQKIIHIPKVLYYWRIHGKSVASDLSVKPYCLDAARLALQKHLERQQLKGQVENNTILSTYRIRYELPVERQTLLLLTLEDKNQLPRVQNILSSLNSGLVSCALILPEKILPAGRKRTYYEKQLLRDVPDCQFVYYQPDESLAVVLNRTIAVNPSDYLAFVDGAVIRGSDNWLDELLMFAQRDDVAAATGQLTSRGLVYQAGLAFNSAGSVVGYHNHRVVGEPGYMARLTFVNNVSLADRTACLIKRTRFLEMGGFNEAYQRDFFDLDLLLRLNQKGYTSVFTPYASFEVDEPKDLPSVILNRGLSLDSSDRKLFRTTWGDYLKQPDPYYNPNFNQLHVRFDQR